MCDLKLAIDGTTIQLSQSENPDQFLQTSAALARACSIFLRKMVLGDRDDPKTRLLDDEISQSLDLRFERLRRISPNRIPLEILWKLDGGNAQFTKLDDNTLQPEADYSMRIAPSELKISICWGRLVGQLDGNIRWTSIERAFALAKAARVIIDEGEIGGLGYEVAINVNAEFSGDNGDTSYRETHKLRVTGWEAPIPWDLLL